MKIDYLGERNGSVKGRVAEVTCDEDNEKELEIFNLVEDWVEKEFKGRVTTGIWGWFLVQVEDREEFDKVAKILRLMRKYMVAEIYKHSSEDGEKYFKEVQELLTD